MSKINDPLKSISYDDSKELFTSQKIICSIKIENFRLTRGAINEEEALLVRKDDTCRRTFQRKLLECFTTMKRVSSRFLEWLSSDT